MVGHISSFPYVAQNYPPFRPLEAEASNRLNHNRLRVLVVDDDLRIADTTAEVLEQAGFDAQAAYSGDSALQLAARFRPDCLLSDVVMSGMNGVELAVAFQQAHPTSRVVLITGQAGISDVLDEAERQGFAFEVLSKPIHPRKLIDELRKTPKR
jgi:two-component system OmpR family response regulator